MPDVTATMGFKINPSLTPRAALPLYLIPTQQMGMDDSKHGGQTYPEMVKGTAATSA